MTIRDFYRVCLSMQSKTKCRVYYEERCVYNGEYCNMPYAFTNHEVNTLIVNPDMEWKFYI